MKADSTVSAAQSTRQGKDSDHDRYCTRAFSVHVGHRAQDNARDLSDTIFRTHWRGRDHGRGVSGNRFVASAS